MTRAAPSPSPPLRPARVAAVALVVASAGAIGCGPADPPQVDWCAVPLSSPVAPRAEPDGGLIYEIFVRSFQDSDGDGVGDLAGVTARLDHLESLGVTALWLMPIFESPDRSGYAPVSWSAVEADYGGEADFDSLVEAAADRGMRVLLDVPFNHTSAEHPWFQAALAEPDSPHVTDYLFSEHQWDEVRWFPTGDGRFYYGFFGQDYPDLDLTRVSVMDRLSPALGAWLDRGAGGYRVDAVLQLIEDDEQVSDSRASHCLMAWVTQEIHQADPTALVLSEAWSQLPARNLSWLGDEAAPESDLVLDVPRWWANLVTWRFGDTAELRAVLQAELDAGQEGRVAPYLGSHDVDRSTLTIEDARARRAAMVLHLLGPGQPVLYYGEEIDLPSPDPTGLPDLPQRGPMLWDDTLHAGFTSGAPWFPVDPDYLDGRTVAAQAEDEGSMLSLVRALAALRARSPALRTGATTLLPSEVGAVLALSRMSDEDGVVVVINSSADPQFVVELDLPGGLGPWTDLVTGEPVARDDGGHFVHLRYDRLDGYAYKVYGTLSLARERLPGQAPAAEPTEG